MTTPTIKARFEAWLRDRNPSANVGESGSCVHCPFAMYLQCNGYPAAEVGQGKDHVWIELDLHSGRVQAPPWVQHFVTLIDSLRDSKGNVRDHMKVRAYQAWAILGRIG